MRILGGGVPGLILQLNPELISDQKMSFSASVFRPGGGNKTQHTCLQRQKLVIISEISANEKTSNSHIALSFFSLPIWTETTNTVEPRLTTTAFIRPPRYHGHILSNQKYKTLTHFIILKTPLMRPPRYYDQDFMAQRWSY